MNKLLRYDPEPFPELDQEAENEGFDPITGEWEAEATEEESRRSRRPRLPKKAPRRYTKKPVFRSSAKLRVKIPPAKPTLQPAKVLPRINPVVGLRPVPIPYIPLSPDQRSDLQPVATGDVPRPDESRRSNQAGPEGSGTSQTTQPSEEPASEYVRWVQSCLNLALGLNLRVEGIMNRETRSAVRLFQERRGLPITGLIGPGTERALSAACRLWSQASRSVPHAEYSYDPFQADLAQGEYGDFEYPEFEEDLFLGKALRRASHVVSRAAQTVGRTAGRAAKGAYKTARRGTRYVGKAYKTAARYSQPPGLRALARFGRDVARGRNVVRAFRAAAKAGIADVRNRLRYAQMVSSFVPGVGTGIAAALGAVNALAAGRPITDAMIEAARSAIPGGALAQAAFDVGVNLAKGRSLSQAALNAARNRLPLAGRSAFDTAVALGKGQNLQKAARAGAGHILSRSPYAANALAFARRAGYARNLQYAALSPSGRRVFRRMLRELDEFEYESPSEFEIPSPEEMQAIEREFLSFNSRLSSGGMEMAS
jgi:peptidoglycan hydrolase-like protein with peptidoglycan-binding domain